MRRTQALDIRVVAKRFSWRWPEYFAAFSWWPRARILRQRSISESSSSTTSWPIFGPCSAHTSFRNCHVPPSENRSLILYSAICPISFFRSLTQNHWTLPVFTIAPISFLTGASVACNRCPAVPHGQNFKPPIKLRLLPPGLMVLWISSSPCLMSDM